MLGGGSRAGKVNLFLGLYLTGMQTVKGIDLRVKKGANIFLRKEFPESMCESCVFVSAERLVGQDSFSRKKSASVKEKIL